MKANTSFGRRLVASALTLAMLVGTNVFPVAFAEGPAGAPAGETVQRIGEWTNTNLDVAPNPLPTNSVQISNNQLSTRPFTMYIIDDAAINAMTNKDAFGWRPLNGGKFGWMPQDVSNAVTIPNMGWNTVAWVLPGLYQPNYAYYKNWAPTKKDGGIALGDEKDKTNFKGIYRTVNVAGEREMSWKLIGAIIQDEHWEIAFYNNETNTELSKFTIQTKKPDFHQWGTLKLPEGTNVVRIELKPTYQPSWSNGAPYNIPGTYRFRSILKSFTVLPGTKMVDAMSVADTAITEMTEEANKKKADIKAETLQTFYNGKSAPYVMTVATPDSLTDNVNSTDFINWGLTTQTGGKKLPVAIGYSTVSSTQFSQDTLSGVELAFDSQLEQNATAVGTGNENAKVVSKAKNTLGSVLVPNNQISDNKHPGQEANAMVKLEPYTIDLTKKHYPRPVKLPITAMKLTYSTLLPNYGLTYNPYVTNNGQIDTSSAPAYKDAYGTEEAVNTAFTQNGYTKRVEDATNRWIQILMDKTALETAYKAEEGKNNQEAGFTKASWATYTAKMAEAKKILDEIETPEQLKKAQETTPDATETPMEERASQKTIDDLAALLPTILVSVTPVKVKFQIQNGNWAEGNDTEKEVTVNLDEGHGTLKAADVPTGMEPKQGYSKPGKWNVEPVTTEGGITEATTYVYTFPETPATVTFHIVGGKWSDQTTEDKTVQVALTNGQGTLKETDIPKDMVANPGFGNGQWNTQPNTTENATTQNVTYTYTFTELPAKVTFKIVGGTWDGNDATDKTVDVPLNGGKGMLQENQVPTGMQAAEGYGDGSWNVTPVTTADGITGNTEYTYTFKRKVSHTVTFKAVNGTFSDGQSTKTVTLEGYEGTPLTLKTSDIPVADKPAAGYADGAWNVTPTDGMNITQDKEFVFDYAKKPVLAPVITKNNASQNITITPADETTTKITFNFTEKPYGDEGATNVPLTATKNEQGKWALDNEFEGVSIDAETGAITIKATILDNGTEVSATASNAIDTASIAAKAEAVNPESFFVTSPVEYPTDAEAKKKKIEAGIALSDAGKTANVTITGYAIVSIDNDKTENAPENKGDYTATVTVTYTIDNEVFGVQVKVPVKVTEAPATITFQVVGGTFGGNENDKIVQVPLENGHGTLKQEQIPTDMQPKEGFSNQGSWNEEPSTEENAIDGNKTYIYTFKREVSHMVTFKAVGGTFADGQTTKTVTLKAPEGEAITLPEGEIPQIGAPAQGYELGAWTTEPTAGMEIDADTEFVYHFKQKPDAPVEPADPQPQPENPQEPANPEQPAQPEAKKATITFEIVGGLWSDNTTANKTVQVVLDDQNHGTLQEAQIPTGMKALPGYEGGAWNEVPSTAANAIDGNKKYVYTFTRKAEPVPEAKKATISFEIRGGTWADGSTGEKTVELIMGDNGKATLTAHDVPTGMKPLAGYGNGHWEVAPVTTADGISGNNTYVYVFTKKNAPAQQGGGSISGGSAPSGGGSAPSGGAPSTPSTVKLTFDVEGGLTIPVKDVTAGTVVKLDFKPSKAGFRFAGWYADKELTKPIIEIKVTKNTTIYAKWEVSAPVANLASDLHQAYVRGYPDGTVRPMGNVTRAEVAAMFYRLLEEKVRRDNMSSVSTFADVTASSWFKKAVATMEKMHVVTGRTATTFAPNAPITRAEFVTIASRLDADKAVADLTFTDVLTHWAKKDIAHAVSRGWILGYEDNTFKPNAPITRAETMSIINRMLQRIPESAKDLLPDMIKWPDSNPSDWFYIAVQEATNSHDYIRLNNGYEKWVKLVDTVVVAD